MATDPARKALYGDVDPRDAPTYTVVEAAHHAKLHVSTLRLWIAGRGQGPSRSRPVIEAASGGAPWILSFWNLIEAQVLVEIRRKHQVSMQKVRKSLDFVKGKLGVPRPLINADFKTDGIDLFVENLLGDLVSASRAGEIIEMSQSLEASLSRVVHDPEGLASSYYPWASNPLEPRVVHVDVETAFGRPVVSGTRVPTEVLAGRHNAGDSFKLLARDYKIPEETIKAAILWEESQPVGEAA